MVDGGRMIKKKEMAVPKKTKMKAHGVDLAFDIVVKVLAVLIIIIVMYPLIYVVSAFYYEGKSMAFTRQFYIKGIY